MILQGESISFPTVKIVNLANSGFHCLSIFAFKCIVIQQWETVVLQSMSFEALSCKGGASISICTSRALVLRILVWHLLGSTTVTLLPCILSYGGTRLPIDSYIQHFILATEETTVKQQVSYRLSHANPGRGNQELQQSAGQINGESPLLKPTGIQLATNFMLSTTNGEHRKLIGIETVIVFGYKVRFVL